VVERVNASAAAPAAPNERQAFQWRDDAAEVSFGKYEPVPWLLSATPTGREKQDSCSLAGFG